MCCSLSIYWMEHAPQLNAAAPAAAAVCRTPASTVAAAADLKAANVLLKMELAGSPAVAAAAAASSSNPAPSKSGASNKQQQQLQPQPVIVAKVADFGLATRLDEAETHVSGVHRVSGEASCGCSLSTSTHWCECSFVIKLGLKALGFVFYFFLGGG
jgi:hypothetical protein